MDAIWPRQPHTAAKHEILRRYLGGWFPVLGGASRRILFLDGFAGPGKYAGGEPGSPIVALEVLIDHNHLTRLGGCEFVFLFNEKETPRYNSLVTEIDAYKASKPLWPANVKVEAINQTFGELVTDMLDQLKVAKRNLAPTFAFIDPFGYKDVSMAKIAELLNFQRCELFIYFDFNSAQRFATSGIVDERLKELYGTEEFLEAPPKGDPLRGRFLADLYERQLRDVAHFPYVQRFRMVGSNGKTICYLFYCTRSVRGLTIMKEAMWKVAPNGDYSFHDRFAGQDVLFTAEPDLVPLQHELLRAFAGQRRSIEEVIDFVVVETPYVASHVKRRTLKVMQQAGEISSPNQRMKGTFPPGTLIDFRS